MLACCQKQKFSSGIGTPKECRVSVGLQSKAEVFLYDMVKDGNVRYKKSPQGVIEGRAKVRVIFNGGT